MRRHTADILGAFSDNYFAGCARIYGRQRCHQRRRLHSTPTSLGLQAFFTEVSVVIIAVF